ncbi:MAG: NAD(P)/FAD-dependent oxidoreductase [Gemmataceae bacterium]
MAESVTIVGAGLAGTLLACYLGKAGRGVELYERRADPRTAESERGRSINLALSTRGLHALAEVGLADEVLRAAVKMPGRMIHHLDGSLTYQPYGKDDREVLHSVSRAGLNRLLVEAAARHPTVRLHFDHRCVHADLDEGRLDFRHQGGVKQVAASVIVGADGAHSAVRQAMQRRERFDYSQEYLGHGYKELSVPPGPGGGFRMERHALHIWPRGGFMLIALPNADGSFTCTLFASFEALGEHQNVEALFSQQFPDAVPLLPDLADQFRGNPTGSLVTVRCHPWHHGGRAVLVGDACHAVVPFLGQGMNAAFEDCSVLVGCLAKHDSPEAAFAEYGGLRKPHLDALARLCVDNFLEMRDRVGSRWFVLRKRLSLLLYRLLPGWYRPLYTMIEFSRIPYADAERRARRQEWWAAGVAIGLMTVASALLGMLLR